MSAIGDCIHTMPLVGAIRARYPDAFIAWATQPGPASLLTSYPGLDQVVIVKRDWMKSWHQVTRLRRHLQSLKFDFSVDAQSLTKSALLGWISGARRRIGFAAPQGRELSLWLNNERIQPRSDHVVDRYLELLKPILGDELPEARFELPVTEHEVVKQFLDNTGLRDGYAVINPGAGWDSKLWLPARFGRVARHLGDMHRLPTVVVWAGHRELIWAKEIVARSGGHAWLAPDTSLPELASVLSQARLCVAADTGPLHLAAAVGTPCVGLYGPTRPRHSGPYGQGHQTVQVYYQSGSSRERRQADNDAMRAIEVAMVTNACDRVIARSRGSRAA
jgi:ADP-heptose:LPS heptosyltransferase